MQGRITVRRAKRGRLQLIVTCTFPRIRLFALEPWSGTLNHWTETSRFQPTPAPQPLPTQLTQLNIPLGRQVGRQVVLHNVLGYRLTYQGQAETNAEAWFNIASTETRIKALQDGQPRTATSTLTQLLNYENIPLSFIKFYGLLTRSVTVGVTQIHVQFAQ